jgi:hypothetical protein
MKRIALFLACMVFGALVLAPVLSAQDDNNGLNHGEVGAFFNFTRLNHASENWYGVGGRIGFNIHPNIQLEAEGAYDWNRNYSSSLTNVGGGTSIVTSNLRLVHGLFGPKFDFTHGAFRPFVTAKGGFLNFSGSNNFTGTLNGIPNGDTNGVFYPGGGIEGFIGWFGIRVEAGDEIYFDNGANHNFRFTAGPQFRF